MKIEISTCVGQYNPSTCLFVCFVFIRALSRFQQYFSHIATVSGCGRELNAHFSSAASLKYHAPDT